MLSTTSSSTSLSAGRRNVQRCRPFGSFAASELDETRLGFPIDFRHCQRTLSGIHRGTDPFDCTPFAYTLDCAHVYIQVFCNFLVCQTLISLERNPRMQHFEC